MKEVTIVVPAYNEAENLTLFTEETERAVSALSDYHFTYLFVNDGSSDNTEEVLKDLSKEKPSVSFLSFSRNFGKEAAIYAGLSHAEGDYVILLDADLQHPPELIPDMLKAVSEEGFYAAGAKRKSGISSRLFTFLNNKISDVKLVQGATDYMCMSRAFVDAVLQLSEKQRFSKGLFAWVGFDVKWFDYEQNPRVGGKSKWTKRKLASYAADGLTSFSIFPLRLVSAFGAVISLVAFLYILATLIKTWITGIDVPGYVTTLCAILFLGGVVLLAIGILGSYIGRSYLETKNRPLYILKENSRNQNRAEQTEKKENGEKK